MFMMGRLAFDSREEATDYVLENARATGDYTFALSPFQGMWAYLEWYELPQGGMVQVKWEFDADFIKTHGIEDYPWDNGTAIVTDNGCAYED